MNRGLVRVAVLSMATAAVITGCSVNGTVTVTNNSSNQFSGTLDGTRFKIQPGESFSKTIYVGKSAGVIGPNELNVYLHGSSWTKRPFTDVITVKGDETMTYSIVDDTGAVFFENGHITSIKGIQFKECSNGGYGLNILKKNKVMLPSDVILIQLDEGCWDFLINYGVHDYYDFMGGIDIETGKVTTLIWSP